MLVEFFIKVKRFDSQIGTGCSNQVISSGRNAKLVESSTHSNENAAMEFTCFTLFKILVEFAKTVNEGDNVYESIARQAYAAILNN